MSNDKNVKVISDATFAELNDIFRKLHHITLNACVEVGEKPTFADNISKFTDLDYKALRDTYTRLHNAARKAEWEKRASVVKAALLSAVSEAVAKVEARWERFQAMSEEDREGLIFNHKVVLPFEPLKACFGDMSGGERLALMKDLGWEWFKNDTGAFIRFNHKPAKATTSEQAAA